MRAIPAWRRTEPVRARRIGFLFGKPTQFEAPFFRYAQSTGERALKVIYLDAHNASTFEDAELGRRIDWGIDLYSGYEHASVPARGKLNWFRDELRPDSYGWLVINGYTAPPYLMAFAVARLRGIRTALRIDSVLFNAAGFRRRGTKRLVMAALARSFDKFLATGTLAREYLLHFGVSPERIAQFPYVVDAERFAGEAKALEPERAAMRRSLRVPADARVVLVVAKMNAREAPWDLLGALEGLDRPDLWTVLVGDGEELPALRSRIESRGLKRMVLAGYVPYRELPRFYAMADLFVHAAANEPWGVSVHEAIASGLPVIASSCVGAARDLVLPGRNGFVYASGDAVELRERLTATIDRLDAETIARANGEVLARWNYAETWKDLLEACA